MAVTGSTQRLIVEFVTAVGGSAVDPSTGPELTIYYDGVAVLGPLEAPDVVRDAVGLFHYDWTIALDADLGTYTAAWSGLIPGASSPSTAYEYVTVTAIPNPGAPYAPVDPFGASAQGAIDLVPEARIRTGPPVAGQYGVTIAQVQAWVEELTGVLGMTLDGWERLSDSPEDGQPTSDREDLASYARTVIHNGAASYLEAARHPERAGVNDTSYAAVLWARYLEGLDRLTGWLAARLAALEPGDEDYAGGPDGSFPDPLFGDGLRF